MKIPIAIILASRFLPARADRLANIIAGSLLTDLRRSASQTV
jgi:hypothetical protein